VVEVAGFASPEVPEGTPNLQPFPAWTLPEQSNVMPSMMAQMP
jgi:hypothetical protein